MPKAHHDKLLEGNRIVSRLFTIGDSLETTLDVANSRTYRAIYVRVTARKNSTPTMAGRIVDISVN